MLISRRALLIALLVIGVALFSPIEEMAHALASAHMVQHLLLILVAGPLIAYAVRIQFAIEWLSPTVAWLLHTTTIWLWHAAGPYTAAVVNPIVHGAEHLTFLLTAVVFWSAVGIGRNPDGLGVLLVFGMALQSVFLALLLTFAETPWYWVYEATTQAYGLDPLSDQQLAGVIMWVPAGLVYTGIGLALLLAWVRQHESAPQVARSSTP
ncbi:MAG: cytochrome c oxidase assembly protein [Acidimicrobiia bacterium]